MQNAAAIILHAPAQKGSAFLDRPFVPQGPVIAKVLVEVEQVHFSELAFPVPPYHEGALVYLM
jgi:hypothetical protein